MWVLPLFFCLYSLDNQVPESYRPPGCGRREISGQFLNVQAFKAPCRASKQPPQSRGRAFLSQGLLQVECLFSSAHPPPVPLPWGSACTALYAGLCRESFAGIRGMIAVPPVPFLISRLSSEF